MKVRIKFRKYDVMKFIGHLDIMRYFQKAIRRASLPIAYSGGYSPHQVMSFAAPLGVGLESNGEYMDIELLENTLSGKNIKDALNRTMVEGMEILSVKSLPEDAKNAMASVAAARYSISFSENKEQDIDWDSQTETFYNRLTILVNKKTKKSTIEMDLKPHIYEMKALKKGISMLVDASSAGNIKPSLVMEAFYRYNNIEELSEFSFMVTREDTYGNKGSFEHPIFVPLEEFGEDF